MESTALNGRQGGRFDDLSLPLHRSRNFFHTAMFFIPHFITRSNCSSSFAIMGGFERGVLGALFVTFSHFGSV